MLTANAAALTDGKAGSPSAGAGLGPSADLSYQAVLNLSDTIHSSVAWGSAILLLGTTALLAVYLVQKLRGQTVRLLGAMR